MFSCSAPPSRVCVCVCWILFRIRTQFYAWIVFPQRFQSLSCRYTGSLSCNRGPCCGAVAALKPRSNITGLLWDSDWVWNRAGQPWGIGTGLMDLQEPLEGDAGWLGSQRGRVYLVHLAVCRAPRVFSSSPFLLRSPLTCLQHSPTESHIWMLFLFFELMLNNSCWNSLDWGKQGDF